MERASLSENQASVSSGNSVSAPSVSEEVRGPEKEAPSPAGEKSEEARSSSALEETVPEETEPQTLVEQLQVTNELLSAQTGLLAFIAGFLLFLFVYRLISRFVTIF